MANNTPAVSVPRQFRGIPYAPRESAGGARQPRGGTGRNPLVSSYGEGDVDEPYVAPSGGIAAQLIAQQFNKGIASRNEEKHHAANAAQQERVQAGVDAFMGRIQNGDTPDKALANVFHPDSEGHVHFTDPTTFNSIISLHKVLQGTGQAQGTGQFQTVPLDGNLVGVVTPDGKYKVMKGSAAGAGASHTTVGQRIDESGNTIPTIINRDTGTSRDVTMESGEGVVKKAPGPAKPLSKAENDEITNLDTVMQGLSRMQSTVGATGLLTGHLQRFLGQHTEFSPTQAAEYNQAYDSIAPALVHLNRVPGQSKQVSELALQQLPHPGQAEAYNTSQVIPGLEMQMRFRIANLYQAYKAQGKDTSVVQQLAMTNDAGPARMGLLRGALQQLDTGAGQLNEEQMGILQNEQLHNNLTFDQSMRVTRQRIARGMMDPKEFDKAVAAWPGLAQITDAERTDPRYVRQFGSPPGQPIPSDGAQPPQAAPPGQQPAQPPQARPAPSAPPQAPQPGPGAQIQPGAQMAPGGPPQSPQPQQVSAPPQPPSGGQQQADIGSQIQQQQAGQAPPAQQGQTGIFQGLLDKFANAIGGLHSKMDMLLQRAGAGSEDQSDTGTQPGPGQ